jgi:cysteine-rich repeat protein
MRSLGLCVATVLLVAAPWGAGALEEGRPLLRCQQQVIRAAGRYARARHRALSRCFEKTLRCPSALEGGATAASDQCLAAVGAHCNRMLGKSARKGLLVERAGPTCTLGRLRVSDGALFSDEGLGFSLLAPLCPEVAVSESSAESGSTCQQRALTCSIDTAVARSFPRAAELLIRLGIPSGVGARCLMASLCGNAIIDGDEECDRGPANSDSEPDACRTTCLEPSCGDGVVDEEEAEECDDGNHRNGDGCDEDCFREDTYCGDGVVDVLGDEECDDGNTRRGDGCDDDCLQEDTYCGDGTLDLLDGEECDDGNAFPGDGCDEDCLIEDPDFATCGNGIVDDEEDCDAGLQNSDVLPNSCRTDCTEPECGDGVIDPAYDESCEPPGTILCDDSCALRPPVFMRIESPAAPATECQLAITAAGQRLFRQTRAGVGACVGHLARCVLGFSEAHDPDGDKADACLERADRRCLRIAERMQAGRARLTGQVSTRCSGTTVAALLDQTTGPGFVEIASACHVSAGTTPSLGDLVRCALDNVRCGAESTIADGIPRAYELLTELVEVDADESFPCVRDPDELDE